MTQIKAAFFDIDGTLLPFHAKALPESTVQARAAASPTAWPTRWRTWG